MSLPRKLRKRDLVALGEAPSVPTLSQRIARGQFPPPDTHDPVDGAAIWFETTIAAHRERERGAPAAPKVSNFPKQGLAARARKRVASLVDGEGSAS